MRADQDTIEVTESLDIAIIGLSGRFPGANNIDEFWQNLRNGVESIRQFTDAELIDMGVSPASLRDPNFVKAGAILENIDMFDAKFFGYSPREAEIIDLQQRIFLECAWHAMENAGYGVNTAQNLVGVFAGASLSTYLLDNLLANKDTSLDIQDARDTFQTMISNDKDFLTTRVSYELNLMGPSIDIQTACSTSLVAVHMACQSLLSYQCDMALAGGVSIQVPQRTGYYYIPGGISSPDGHCRAFDARAQGTVFGSGVGIVVLKRLADALSDNDTIYAIIKGSALSNDGSSKIGYTAPSVDGQAQAIAMAQSVAGVDAETITYVEAHGTGTALGDPVEIAALTTAFRASTDKKNFCAIGSVKTNIGHLDAAAGIAGLIKAILALRHRQLPASLHFQQPNPQIDLASSPFYVNSRLQEWKSDGLKLRAGVSSFGVGGTNAHVILEQAPEIEPSSASREHQLIVISAKSGSALETASRNLAKHLRQHQGENLVDVAYTLQVGRKKMGHRRAMVCRDVQEAIRLLDSDEPARVLTVREEAEDRSVVFMFPGGGAQYVNMGLGLYQTEKVFRQEVDRCCELLKASIRYDLRDYIYPKRAKLEEAIRQMKRPSIGLPALFAVEYAMARQLDKWGVKADAMIGHSLGEYTAACLAGVFTLEDVLKIVRLRGELFEELPKGGMVSIDADEEEVRGMIGEGVSIAAVNGPRQVVVSGKEEAIVWLCQQMEQIRIEHRRVQIEVAAHSPLVERVLDRYEEFVRGVRKEEPRMRYVSNVSGKWVKKEDVIDARYWRRQLRECVRFSDGMEELVKAGAEVMVEVGPGQTLSSLAKMQKREKQANWVIGTMRHPQKEQDDRQCLTEAIGRLWMAGVEIDWGKYYEIERRRRIELPAYPFERQRYWIEERRGAERQGEEKRNKSRAAGGGKNGGKRKDVKEWFYVPEWQRLELRRNREPAGVGVEKRKRCIVMEGSSGFSRRLVERLREESWEVITVKAGDGYRRVSEKEYEIRAGEKRDYQELLRQVVGGAEEAVHIVHVWGIDDRERQSDVRSEERFRRDQRRGFNSLLCLAQAIEAGGMSGAVSVDFVSRGMQEVESSDVAAPEQATALGACKVISQECERVKCRSIDIGEVKRDRQEMIAVGQLIDEIDSGDKEQEVVYRGRRRYVRRYEPVLLDKRSAESVFRKGGVYMITGGTGGIGTEVAEYLCKKSEGKVALVSRRGIEGIGEENARRIEGMGESVMVERADVGDEEEMKRSIERVERRFGRINGLIHAAGLAGENAVKLIPEVTMTDCEIHFRAKVYGLYVLTRILRGRDLDFCLLFSSNASILGGLGSICYSAANIFMDFFACKHNKTTDTRWISANWDGWLLNRGNRLSSSFQTSLDQYAMTCDESIDALEYALSSEIEGQVVISTGDLADRLAIWTRQVGNRSTTAGADANLHTRPALTTAYVAASTEIERVVVNVWQDTLGIDRLGIHDNFFDLGGNSLIGLKAISRLKKELNIDIPVTALFEGPTISALARVISRGQESNGKVEEPAYEESRRRGERRSKRIRYRHGTANGILDIPVKEESR
jgi:phthiocerol/phenolphthiocerol synthesis type-I polyketide synthase E